VVASRCAWGMMRRSARSPESSCYAVGEAPCTLRGNRDEVRRLGELELQDQGCAVAVRHEIDAGVQEVGG